MKTILSLVVLLSSGLSIQSHAQISNPASGPGTYSVSDSLLSAARPAVRYYSEIVRLDLAPEFQDQTVDSGHVILDLEARKTQLTVFKKKVCPANFFCTQEMPMATVIELPLIGKSMDSCGNPHFIAQQDKRPVDGNLQELEVVDYRKNQCPTFVALPDVSIAYRVVTSGRGTGGPVRSVSTFEGSALKRIR